MARRCRPGMRLISLAFAVVLLAGLIGCSRQHASQADDTSATIAQAPTEVLVEAKPVKGELSSIGEGEDEIALLKVWGTPYEMGYAQGKLCADTIKGFYERTIIAMTLGAKVKPEVLDEAWAQMAPFVAERHKEEMRGLAEGAGVDLKLVHRAHAIPDLSEFHCTFFGAWGDATGDGHLHQIRALDSATQAGIQDAPALIVHKPADHNAFVNIGWLGFIGVVSGMNDKQIALSQIGEHFSDEVETLAGEPMPLLMRRVLEEASDLDAAIGIFKNANRTRSYLYCVGDAKIPEARALRTSKDFCEVYGPDDHGDLSLPNVVFWSMGCDSDWNQKVHDALKANLGEIAEQVGMSAIMKGLRTGSLHAVHYDVSDLELWVANATPGPEISPAYNENFVHFSLAEALQ